MMSWAKEKVVPLISTVLPPSVIESLAPISQPVEVDVVSSDEIKKAIESFAEDISSFRKAYRMDCAVNEIRNAVDPTVSQTEDEAKAANAQAIQRVLEEFRDDISLFGKQFFTSVEKNHSNWKELLGVLCVHHKSTNQFAWVDKKAEAKYLSYLNKMVRSGDIDKKKLTSLRESKDGAMSRQVKSDNSGRAKSLSRQNSRSAFPGDLTTSPGSISRTSLTPNAQQHASSTSGSSDISSTKYSAGIKLEPIQQIPSKQRKVKVRKYVPLPSDQKVHSVNTVDHEVCDNDVDSESSSTISTVVKQKDQYNLSSMNNFAIAPLNQTFNGEPGKEEREEDREENANSKNQEEKNLVPVKQSRRCEIL